MSRTPGIQTSGTPYLQNSRMPALHNSMAPQLQYAGAQDSITPERGETRIAGFHNSGTHKIQKYTTADSAYVSSSGRQNSRTRRFRNSRNPGSQNSGYQRYSAIEFQLAGFRNYRRTQFQTSRTPDPAIPRIPKHANSAVPELWIPGVLQNVRDIFHKCGLVYVCNQ